MIIAQCVHDISLAQGLYISMLLAGLVGGFSHCTVMCSPFVLAQVEANKEYNLSRLRSSLLIPYHLGRMTTYIALAVLFNSVINLAFMYTGLKPLVAAPMLMLAGVLFFVSAFPQMLSVFPWAGNVRVYVPYALFSKVTDFFQKSRGPLGRYGLGVLLGFMPCGLVMAALLATSTASTMLEAGIAMGVFALGTVPSLFLVAFGGQFFKNKYPKFSKRFSQGAMVISGLWLFVLAGGMFFGF